MQKGGLEKQLDQDHILFFFLEMEGGLIMLPQLVLNSWPQGSTCLSPSK